MAEIEIAEDWDHARGALVNIVNQLNSAVNGNGREGLTSKVDRILAFQEGQHRQQKDTDRSQARWMKLVSILLSIVLAVVAILEFQRDRVVPEPPQPAHVVWGSPGK